ncbi:MAG: hypothetical protein JSW18_04025 [Candidatus Omnitrophota bacterium]|nr:MAG: hypothetical protein JSW18_04025 [Candidatus Omnitrophota bacterium]
MRRYAFFIFIFIAIVCFLLLVWYLNQTLIPEKLKTLLTSTIEKQTRLSIDIGSLRFHIARGFELENIKIFKKGEKKEPIFKADRAYFKPLLIPSLRKIHIVIPGLLFESAYIKIERDETGNWNFGKPALLKAEPPLPKKRKFYLSILKASITGGTVVFNDNFQDSRISETLTDVKASIGLSLPHSLSLVLNAQIHQSPINVKGKIAHPFKNAKTTLKITATELDLKKIKNLSNTGVLDGLAKIKADVFLEPDGTSIIKAVGDIESLKFRKQNLRLVGDFDIDGQLLGNIKIPKDLAYKGKIKFKNATLALSDTLPEIFNAAGEAIFINKSVTIKDSTGGIAGSPVSLSGKLDYTAEFPEIDINILANAVNLNQLIQSLPQQAKVKFKEIDLEGEADLNINIATEKAQPQALIYKGDLKISGANLSCPWLKEKIKNIDCEIIFQKDRLAWDKLSFKYNDIPYASSGIATELKEPLINGALESKDLKAKGIIKIGDDLINILGLNIAYKNYSLQAKGFLKDSKQPLLNLIIYSYDGIADITARLNLKSDKKPYLVNIEARNINIGKFISGIKFSKSKVKGILASKATLNGYLDDKDSLKGNGWVQVTEGYLGKFPVVADLLDAILGIPPEYLILTDAFGNFSVSDKRIYTRDFKILSQKAALVWEGSVGFDSTLDFNVTGRFAEDITTRATAFGKIASAVLHEAGAYMVEVKLTGTIEKPEYKIVPFPIRKIMKGKVIDKLKDVLGDIFE